MRTERQLQSANLHRITKLSTDEVISPPAAVIVTSQLARQVVLVTCGSSAFRTPTNAAVKFTGPAATSFSVTRPPPLITDWEPLDNTLCRRRGAGSTPATRWTLRKSAAEPSPRPGRTALRNQELPPPPARLLSRWSTIGVADQQSTSSRSNDNAGGRARPTATSKSLRRRR